MPRCMPPSTMAATAWFVMQIWPSRRKKKFLETRMTASLLPDRSCRAETQPPVRKEDLAKARSRAWRVIHACEFARDVLPVVEGQVAAGMKPYIVTPQGAGSAEVYLSRKDLEHSRPLSLLRAW